MNISPVIGFVAAACTTLAFVPQVWRSLRTHNTGSLSLGMYAVFTLGTMLWVAYGAWSRDLPVLLANAVTLCLAGVVLILKLRYG
ncbi:MAG: SemiSWEET transporter [Gammaproteobacteria bacterium]